MKRNIKKVIGILLILAMLFSTLSAGAYASDISSVKTQEVTMNEWDKYQEIIKKSDSELLKTGYSETEIQKIREFDYETEVRKTAKLSDETLKRCGYSDKDIVALRKAVSMEKIPDSVMRSISTSTMTTRLEYVTKGTDEYGDYYVDLKFSWQWNRLPFFKFYDMVAIAFNSSNSESYIYTRVGGYKVRASLQPIISGTTITNTAEWDATNRSISAKFLTSIYDGDTYTHFAYSGFGRFRLVNASNTARLYIDACYGHSVIEITPSFSVGLSGVDVSVNFEGGMDEQHCKGYFRADYTMDIDDVYAGTIIGRNNTGGTYV